MSVGKPMPRLTYWPSLSSRATRAASCVRVSATSAPSAALARRDALDALAAGADLHDALHEDAGQMHLLGIERARLHELLDFRDRDLAGHRAQRVEVARRFVEHEVAVTVADARAHQREVGDDAFLQHVVAAAERAHVFFRRRERDRAAGVVAPRQTAVGDLRADARRRVETRDAAA